MFPIPAHLKFITQHPITVLNHNHGRNNLAALVVRNRDAIEWREKKKIIPEAAQLHIKRRFGDIIFIEHKKESNMSNNCQNASCTMRKH